MAAIRHHTAGEGNAILWPSDPTQRRGTGYVPAWIGTGYVTAADRHEWTKAAMAAIADRFGGRVRVVGPDWYVEYNPADGAYEVHAGGQPVIISGRTPEPHEADVLANR
jgi:hypothetical protein